MFSTYTGSLEGFFSFFFFFFLFVPSEQKSSVELDQLDQVCINSKDDVSILAEILIVHGREGNGAR